jgi:uroporphyrinogen decarboxylase
MEIPMHEMTSRERVDAALNHQEPDRVPLDIGGGQSSSLSVEAYEALAAKIGVTPAQTFLNKAFRVAWLDEATLVRLGSDVRPVTLRGPKRWSPPPTGPGTLVDELGVTWRQISYAGGFYWEQATYPLADATLADLDRYPWPDPDDPGRYEGLAEEVEALYRDTPYALMGDSGYKNHWEVVFTLLGMERALMAVVAEEEFIRGLLDRIAAIAMTVTRRFLEIAGPYLSVIRTSDDLATQRGPMMSPATYRKMIQPYHRRFFASIKQYTDAKIFYHSCGNVVPLLDDLIEAGVEVLNPVQVAAFADPAAVKARYGDRLSFWGGIDTQWALPRGTAEEVRDEVRLRIRQFGLGGGFVAAAVHNIQPDVPPENILAMSRTVREFGRYPIRGDR